jgi:enamine deaminase RidA (YjgF/YER057c/UK114 family)
MGADLRDTLDEMGLTLPPPPKSVADYIPALLHGQTVRVSGQLPLRDGELLMSGPMPGAGSLAEAQAAAELCVLNGLAAAGAVLDGDFGRVQRVLQVTVYVAGSPDYTEQHKVANGASELLGRLFGESGRHSRVAVGVSALPLGATVEVALTLAVN